MSARCSACRAEAWTVTAAPVVLDPEHVTASGLRAVGIGRSRLAAVVRLVRPVARRVLRAGVPVCDVCALAAKGLSA